MKLILLSGLITVGLCGIFLKSLFGTSKKSNQDRYESNDNPESPVIISGGINVSEIEYSINNPKEYVFSVAFDEESPTEEKDRWFGIDNIGQNDTIFFKIWLKNGDIIKSKAEINNISLPCRIFIKNDGQATVQAKHTR